MTHIMDKVCLVVVFGSDHLAYFFSYVFYAEKKEEKTLADASCKSC